MANKYHLTLEDADSGMTLGHKKPGYIEVGLSEQGVEFSLPVSFLETFVQSIGGTITIPDTVGRGIERVRLDANLNVDKKIQFIKDVRQFVSDEGAPTPGLKETKDWVEAAMAGGKPEIFIGPTDQAANIIRRLRNAGWMAFSETV
jgi:hypothetical protein